VNESWINALVLSRTEDDHIEVGVTRRWNVRWDNSFRWSAGDCGSRSESPSYEDAGEICEQEKCDDGDRRKFDRSQLGKLHVILHVLATIPRGTSGWLMLVQRRRPAHGPNNTNCCNVRLHSDGFLTLSVAFLLPNFSRKSLIYLYLFDSKQSVDLAVKCHPDNKNRTQGTLKIEDSRLQIGAVSVGLLLKVSSLRNSKSAIFNLQSKIFNVQ